MKLIVSAQCSPAPPAPVTICITTAIGNCSEKNNGDTFGDVGFYLTNHNLPYLCANDPNSSTCTEANAIERVRVPEFCCDRVL